MCARNGGGYFNCALCNHYPNEESACKFHTDPEHGSFWKRLTCVVSAGKQDVRKFVFRPIPDINEWDKYEPLLKQQGGSGPKDNGDGVIPAVIYVFPGDVVEMHAECNDLFHRAVYGRQDVGVGVDTASSDLTSKNSADDWRVSLVFKRAWIEGMEGKGMARLARGGGPGEPKRLRNAYY